MGFAVIVKRLFMHPNQEDTMQQEPIRRDGTRVAYGAPIRESALATNKVLRNTYMLLSMTLLFSAAMAGVSIALRLPSFGPLLTLGGMCGRLCLCLLYTSPRPRDPLRYLVCRLLLEKKFF